MPTDEKKVLTTTALFAAASGTIQRGRMNRDVVDYATAVGETKVRMDRLIETLDSKDQNSVMTFAKGASQTLGNVVDEIMTELQSTSSLLAPFDAFKQEMYNFDFDTLSETVEGFSQSVTRKLKIDSYNPVFRFFTNLFSSNDDTSVTEARAEISKNMQQLGRDLTGFQVASDAIPDLVARLDTLRDALTEAYSDYGLYIGVALEKLRRMETDEIPSLQAEVQAGNTPKQEELLSAYMTMMILNKKITNMDNFHKQSLLNFARIRNFKKSLDVNKLNLDEKQTVSEGKWEGVKVSEIIHEEIIESFESGAVNPVLLTQLIRNKAENLSRDAEYLSRFNHRQASARAELENADREFQSTWASLYAPLNSTEVEQAKKEAKELTRNTTAIKANHNQDKPPAPVIDPPIVK